MSRPIRTSPRSSACGVRSVVRLALGVAAVFLAVVSVHGQTQESGPRLRPATGGPRISALSATNLELSGRLVVTGTEFGSSRFGSRLLIDGRPSLVTRWSDTEIHAYVPEVASLGLVPVRVVTANGRSNVVQAEVSPRGSTGRVRWRFTCDSLAVRNRPGVGPDGTIYVQDTDAILYALSPQGGLRWILDMGDRGSEGPVVVAPDGTVYAGVNPAGATFEVWAIDPDGTVRWIHEASGGQGLIAGPGLGPDGNVYAVSDFGGPGAFSLDGETGALRWANPGSPPFIERGQVGTEIAFGRDRFYVAFDESTMSPIALLYGLDLMGNQLFAVGRPNDNAQPVVGPEGDVYLEVWVSGSGIRLGSYDPSGSVRWTAFGSPTNVLSTPDVGRDGSIFAVRNSRELWSLAPDGSTNWLVVHPNLLHAAVASPDGSTLVTGGAVIGVHGFFAAFDTAAGALLWTEPIPTDPNGSVVFASTRPLFSADGQTAYAAAEPSINPAGDLHCYLFALDTRP